MDKETVKNIVQLFEEINVEDLIKEGFNFSESEDFKEGFLEGAKMMNDLHIGRLRMALKLHELL